MTSTALAWVCVVLLGLCLGVVFLMRASPAPVSDGILAPLFAANASAALFAGLVFNSPELSHCTSRELRLIVVVIGLLSGFLSAVSWLADEVDRSWLTVVFTSPVLVILLVLILVALKAGKEGTNHEGE